VPGVVELGCDPEVLSLNARVLDALADFGLVLVGESAARGSVHTEVSRLRRGNVRVNVAVAGFDGGRDCRPDLARRALPCSQANGGNLVSAVEGVRLLGVCDLSHCERMLW